MNIITGYKGVPHVTSQQDRYVNQGAYGVDSYILPIGDKFAATIDSATSVTLASGAVSIQGCVAIIEAGQTETVSIDAGTAGLKRYDLICARYTKEASGVESVNLVVVPGTPSESTPVVPKVNVGRIEDGDTPVDFPLYRVGITGITISSVTRVGSINNSIKELMTVLSQHTSSINTINSTLNTVSTKVTQHTGQISTINTKLGVKSSGLYFTSPSDMWSKLDDAGVSTHEAFTFRGSESWTEDVIAGNHVVAWGIGTRSGTDTVYLLCISEHKLHWWVVNRNGTGSGYIPLDLRTNI